MIIIAYQELDKKENSSVDVEYQKRIYKLDIALVKKVDMTDIYYFQGRGNKLTYSKNIILKKELRELGYKDYGINQKYFDPSSFKKN